LLVKEKDELTVCGGFHPETSKFVRPLEVTLRIKLQLTKSDETVYILQQYKVVTVFHKSVTSGSWNKLLAFKSIIWHELSPSCPPRAIVTVKSMDESELCLRFFHIQL
jgi:hypothetical protein